ncbi:MAG TPA: DUF2270 domain-containing protein [Anaerolineae bacterium]
MSTLEDIETVEETKSAPETPDLERLWQFAGQGLRSSDFNTAMVHLYRGEIARSNAWRARLDATTNWAVITTGAALTFAFGDRENPSAVLLIVTLLILLFLFIEARRYRYYELWTYRVRLMETNFFAALLSPPFLPKAEWAEKVSDSLNHPRFPISLLEAFGRRYRRNYAPIFLILAFSWIAKVYSHPDTVRTLAQFVERSRIGPLPGWLVLAIGVIFNGALVAIGIFTAGLREAKGEVLGEAPGMGFVERLRHAAWEAFETDLPRLTRLDTRKQLAYVISDEVEAVSKALLTELGRGVTLINAKGMFTGKEHGVLMCVVEASQIRQLKKLVSQADPKAFVIVTSVQDVRGSGFRPLEA